MVRSDTIGAYAPDPSIHGTNEDDNTRDLNLGREELGTTRLVGDACSKIKLFDMPCRHATSGPAESADSATGVAFVCR
jgi:hypothetical protein